ncbi:hypothetical protein BC826DRAFT_614068 [Russula brevipes]|nr:hypothetical protein BC826DRAFT_614068 [Russula brevipes]
MVDNGKSASVSVAVSLPNRKRESNVQRSTFNTSPSPSPGTIRSSSLLSLIHCPGSTAVCQMPSTMGTYRHIHFHVSNASTSPPCHRLHSDDGHDDGRECSTHGNAALGCSKQTSS